MSDNEDADKLGSIVFPKSLLKKFIRKYEEFPCLWNKNCAAYKDRFQRREAVAQLTELLREHNPTATRVHVLRKIESLRSCMRREHNKVIDSRTKAETPEEVYKPTLWYYNLLSFVFAASDDCFFGYHDDQEKSLAEERNVDSSDDNISNQEENSYGGTETFIQGDQHCSPGPSQLDEVKFTHGNTEPGVKHRYPHDKFVEVSVLPNKPYSKQDGESTAKRLCTRIDDEYDAIGVNVAAKLRSLPFNMRVLAEKLINDVLFQAQINGLSPSTTITNPDLIKQDPLNN